MNLKEKLAAAVNRAKQSPMGDDKPKKKKGKGAYIATAEGKVGRVTPPETSGGYATYQSMDTTGYSKGKKNFVVKENPISGVNQPKIINADSYKTINRKDVPAKIQEFKKGASKTIVYKKPTAKD
jgi:hypothetical protein